MKRILIICLMALLFTSTSLMAQFETKDLPVNVSFPKQIEWTFDFDIYSPVHIQLQNNSGKAISVDYDWFKLIAPDGAEYKIASFRKVEQKLRLTGLPQYFTPHKGRSV